MSLAQFKTDNKSSFSAFHQFKSKLCMDLLATVQINDSPLRRILILLQSLC